MLRTSQLQEELLTVQNLEVLKEQKQQLMMNEVAAVKSKQHKQVVAQWRQVEGQLVCQWVREDT